jgi:hypothetical protein
LPTFVPVAAPEALDEVAAAALEAVLEAAAEELLELPPQPARLNVMPAANARARIDFLLNILYSSHK